MKMPFLLKYSIIWGLSVTKCCKKRETFHIYFTFLLKKMKHSNIFIHIHTQTPQKKKERKKKYWNGNQNDGYHCFCVSISYPHFEMLFRCCCCYILLHISLLYWNSKKKHAQIKKEIKSLQMSNYLHCFVTIVRKLKKKSTNGHIFIKHSRGKKCPYIHGQKGYTILCYSNFFEEVKKHIYSSDRRCCFSITRLSFLRIDNNLATQYRPISISNI